MLPSRFVSMRNLICKMYTRSVTTGNMPNQEAPEIKSLKSYDAIPGPSSLPLIGQLYHFLPGIGKLDKLDSFELAEHFDKNFGPIVKMEGIFGGPDIIFLLDPDSIELILRSENVMPTRPGFDSLEYYRNFCRTKKFPSSPTGLLTDHGEQWKNFRSKVNPVLMQPKTIKLYKKALNEVADDMINRIKLLRNENNMIQENFGTEMNKWALESIGVVALGGRIGCLEPTLPDNSPAKQLIQCIHDLLVTMEKLDFKPSLWRYFATKNYKKAMSLYEHQMNLSELFIKKAIEDFKSKPHGQPDEEKGALEKLLDINEEIAIIMASDMLFAGVDTAANTVMAVLYYLGVNPDKQATLRKEINNTADEKRPYLKACIKESMRMMPVISGNLRRTSKEYNILGYSIPKNTNILFGQYYLSLLESQFPRSKEFLPERWLVDKADPLYYGNAHPFAFGPFGFGARSCIGQRIAYLEMEIFVAKVLQNFNVEWKGSPPKIYATTLNYVLGPYKYIFNDV